MNYENILDAYKSVLYGMPDNIDRINVLDVIDYADSCYVDHCEKLGYVAIEEIEEMRNEVKEECIEVLKDLLDDIVVYEPKSIIEQFTIKIKDGSN